KKRPRVTFLVPLRVSRSHQGRTQNKICAEIRNPRTPYAISTDAADLGLPGPSRPPRACDHRADCAMCYGNEQPSKDAGVHAAKRSPTTSRRSRRYYIGLPSKKQPRRSGAGEVLAVARGEANYPPLLPVQIELQ